MRNPTAVTRTPPPVTWSSDARHDTAMNRLRTQAMATSSRATTHDATTTAAVVLTGLCEDCRAADPAPAS